MEEFIEKEQLFWPDANSVVRLPFLIKGELVVPPRVNGFDLDAALGNSSYACLDDVQVVRDQRFIYVMPRLADPVGLAFQDTDALAARLYSISTRSAVDYAERVSRMFQPSQPLYRYVAGLVRQTSDAPEVYLSLGLSGLGRVSADELLRAIDWELGFGTHDGSTFLDGWTELPYDKGPGLAAVLSGTVRGETPMQSVARPCVRAMPTRQLHITAGNSPMIPMMSCLRALAIKSASIIKIPSGALVAGSALGVALHFAQPDHPLARSTSVVYWQGGDRAVEDALMSPRLLDRVLVWGSPEAVESVRGRTPLLKTVTFNPRYGVSFIGRDALSFHFAETVRRGVTDSMVWNQKACIASLVHYVEADSAGAKRYAAALAEELGAWDERYPNHVDRATLGRIRSARRGSMATGHWFETSGRSAVVCMEGDFDIFAHPMSRIIVVRPVRRLEDVVASLHHGVATVGVFPEARRIELRDRIASRGVSCVLPLGEADGLFPGMPHDSMRPMSELVSWAVA